MGSDISQVDTAWAWEAFEPGAAHPWTISHAAHLYRRAGFAATWADLQNSLGLGPAATLDQLFEPANRPAAFAQELGELGSAMVATGNPRQLSAWWLYGMLHTPDPLVEKATLFWHNHFATSAEKVTNPRLMLDQNELLRRYALGRFEPLVQAMSKDPAMLTWLDSTTNRRIHPNENYARELMELFCLGVGRYSEQDIKELARCFTGWEVRRDRFVFNRYQHDTGIKSLLGTSGPFTGEQAVRIVLDQPAAPRFIARKLVGFFVFDEPSPPESLVEPLAVQLRENDFHIAPVVRRILASNLFFSEHAIGRKVRSPVELGIGLLRALEMRADMSFLADALDRLGQAVFFPPNVKGWDGGRTWISSATLLARTNLVGDLMLGSRANFPAEGLAAQSQRDGAATDEQAVDRLLTLLVAVPIPLQARHALIELARSPGPVDTRLARVVAAIAATPEFQLN
jgi:uncharacterized protein (DUF1800 family)